MTHLLNNGNKSNNKQTGPNKHKSFFTTKETIRKVKRQLISCEKLTTNEISDKELIYKQLMQFNPRKKKFKSGQKT